MGASNATSVELRIRQAQKPHLLILSEILEEKDSELASARECQLKDVGVKPMLSIGLVRRPVSTLIENIGSFDTRLFDDKARAPLSKEEHPLTAIPTLPTSVAISSQDRSAGQP